MYYTAITQLLYNVDIIFLTRLLFYPWNLTNQGYDSQLFHLFQARTIDLGFDTLYYKIMCYGLISKIWCFPMFSFLNATSLILPSMLPLLSSAYDRFTSLISSSFRHFVFVHINQFFFMNLQTKPKSSHIPLINK